MTLALKRFSVWLVRQLVLWIVDAMALGVTALVVPGFTFGATLSAPPWLYALAAAFLLGFANLLIRPMVLMIARPLGFLALFGIGFLVNALTLWMTSWLLPSFEISNVFAALLGGLVFVGVNTLLTTLLELNDEGSLYERRIARIAARQPYAQATEPGVGLVMLEIDGLSYHHMRKALDDGLMPTLSRLIDEEGYRLSRVDCGIPSQTSACQAGIMFGNNDDIPAFRWFDKDEQKLYVSSSDAPAINSRYANGLGLMRGGASIDNMLNGDAEKSMLTLADLRTADREQGRRRTEDVYLLCLNPYFLVRTFVLTLGATVRELWQGWQQRRKDVQPRLNRLAHFYPLVRAGTTVFVRDLSAQLTVMDILRGAPAIYVTWPGYDEVAHHSGPWTADAFGELARYDQVIERIHQVITDKAPRPYELVVLSDHGQSFGATFLQRYGVSLKEFIEQTLPAGVAVGQSIGGDTGATTLSATASTLGAMQQHRVGNSLGRGVAGQGQKLIEKGVRAQEPAAADQAAQILAYGSGNLAQVYFDLHPRRITLDELAAAYPGTVDALVAHEGIGYVAGYAGDGTPVVLGKGGRRDLVTGVVEGTDPLAPYAPADGWGAASLEKRAWQIRKVMDFPHAGDLMVVSTVYPDGTVAALEELIGSHGGMGGEQTDAFLFHSPGITVPETRNSTDVFAILNGRRGGPVVERPVVARVPEVDPWALGNLWTGLTRFGAWGPTAVHCFVFDRRSYQRVVDDPFMTGPALLIALVTLVIVALTGGNFHWWSIPLNLVRWGIATLVVYSAGYLLSHRGTYARTFRAMGFAQIVYAVQLAALVPSMGGFVRLVAAIAGFMAVWVGAATAHEMRGPRTFLLALVPTAVVVLVLGVFVVVFAEATVTTTAVLQALGLTHQ